MLGDDQEFTRRSLKPTNQIANKPSNKNLFQINEDEEEEPFSPSKQHYSEVQVEIIPAIQSNKKTVLGENKNITNSLSNSQSFLGIPKVLDYEGEINDPPQFNSYKKDNADESQYHDKNHHSQATLFNSRSYLQQNQENQRPRSQLKSYQSKNLQNFQSIGQLSDSTATAAVLLEHNSNNIQSQSILINNNSSQKNLEIDNGHQLTEQQEKINGQQFQRQVTTEGKKVNMSGYAGQVQISQMSKEESKDEDSSRIMMINSRKNNNSEQNGNQQKVQQQQDEPKSNIKEIIILVVVIIAMLIGLLYIGYSFYNMAGSGLQNGLSIFGIALLFDFLLMRPISIIVLSIFTTIYDFKSSSIYKQSQIILDEEQVSLLGSLYETYEQPMNMMVPLEQQSMYVSSQKLKNLQNHDDPEAQIAEINQQDMSQYRERIIQIGGNKKRLSNSDQIVLVEATYFYHQKEIQIAKKQSIDKQNFQNTEERSKSPIKRKNTQKNEKLECSQSMIFNAQDILMKKAHTQRLHLDHIDDSNYDIEEIPIYSSRNPGHDQIQPQQISENILPPINGLAHPQQFETPKGLQATKQSFPIIRNATNLNISTSQLVTFNECRESQEQKRLLRDLALGSIASNSSKNLKQNNQEYNSLQRYLNDNDKENVNSNLKSQKNCGSIISSQRKHKYLDDLNGIISPSNLLQVNNAFQNRDEVINFTPQYCSLQKQSSIVQEKFSGKHSQNRKSLCLPDMFSDLQSVNVSQNLQMKKRKSSKNSSKSKRNKENSGLRNSQITTNQKILLASRKSFASPSSIKENLENKMSNINRNSLIIKQQSIMRQSQNPNISPFGNHQINQFDVNPDNYQTMAGEQTNNYPSPRDFNLLESIEFNVQKNPQQEPIKTGIQQLNYHESDISVLNLVNNSSNQVLTRESVNSNLKTFLQPQLKKQKEKNRRIGKMINEKSQDSIRQELNASQEIYLQQRVLMSKDNNNLSQPKGINILKQLNQEEIDLSDQEEIIQNNFDSRQAEETGRAKLFEDSDSSTFRLISFVGGGLGSKQRSKAKLQEPITAFQTQQAPTEDNSSGIDFYSNSQGQAPDHQDQQMLNNSKAFDNMAATQDYKKSKKQSVAEIIVEENLQTYNSSPEKQEKKRQPMIERQQTEINDLNHEDNQEQTDSENRKNYEATNQDYNSNTFEDKYCSRKISKDLPKPLKSRENNKSQNNRKRRESQLTNENFCNIQTFDTQALNSQLKNHQDKKVQKEDLEMIMFKIQDQRRKLKNFLKLARQLKSSKDEKLIKEFLKYLKEVQKPLPISKINELKSLEMMSSPYNQSLIAMIKDEYDEYNKQNKKLKRQDTTGQKVTKSQQRQEVRHGQIISKLSNVYGQQLVSKDYQTNRKENKSRDNSGQFSRQQTKTTRNNMINSRSKMSRESSNSITERPPKIRFNSKGNRNFIQVLDETKDQNSTLDKQMIILENQSRLQFDNSASEEENAYGQQNQLKQNIEQQARQNMIQAIEIQDDFISDSGSEFNNLENFMNQQ